MAEKFEALLGENIFQTAERATQFCKENGFSYVEFSFNGIEISVSENSYPYDIVRIYNLTREVASLKN